MEAELWNANCEKSNKMKLSKMWSMYEIIHIWTAVVDKIEEWSSQLIFQFKQLERRSRKKNQGFNGIRTSDLHSAGNTEVTGSNPIEALIFQASSFQLLKLEN